MAREEATAADMEANRWSCWLSFLTDQALAKGNDAFVEFLNQGDMLQNIPARIWPAGYEPPTSVPGIPEPPSGPTCAATTLLGGILKAKGIDI